MVRLLVVADAFASPCNPSEYDEKSKLLVDARPSAVGPPSWRSPVVSRAGLPDGTAACAPIMAAGADIPPSRSTFGETFGLGWVLGGAGPPPSAPPPPPSLTTSASASHTAPPTPTAASPACVSLNDDVVCGGCPRLGVGAMGWAGVRLQWCVP
jgi:hypothetical protein